MSVKKQNGSSVAWRRVAGRATSQKYRAAYAERRLELAVAAKIHALRQKRGISQQELARLMGTRQSAIARLEGGGENITLARLQRLAAALGAQVRIELESPVQKNVT